MEAHRSRGLARAAHVVPVDPAGSAGRREIAELPRRRSRPAATDRLARPLEPAKWAVVASFALIVAAFASGQA